MEENDDVIHIPIDGVLDLHTFNPKEVASVVGEYLSACVHKDIYEVRIIHGKGKPVGKSSSGPGIQVGHRPLKLGVNRCSPQSKKRDAHNLMSSSVILAPPPIDCQFFSTLYCPTNRRLYGLKLSFPHLLEL
jgi:hypothetical protein